MEREGLLQKLQQQLHRHMREEELMELSLKTKQGY